MTRLIAFYLPQFHPIAENDAWWGRGFTEWSNVTRAQPLFPGHQQPLLPTATGFYDLRLPQARALQAELAAAHGIDGFCYYHYWFNGRRLLETPLNDVLHSGQPDFPFCICWANESWTRRWDGREDEVLLAQNYEPGYEERFIDDALPLLQDPRYIRVDGKPMLLVYRTQLLPDARRAAEIWRERAVRAGLPGLYLVRGESGDIHDPALDGFDASYEFPPHDAGIPGMTIPEISEFHPLVPGDPLPQSVYDYRQWVAKGLSDPPMPYKRHRGIMPRWDNTARRGMMAEVFVLSSPRTYLKWLDHLLEFTEDHFSGDERLVFVNAWNEWAEGAVLEPDNWHGEDYLRATRAAVTRHRLRQGADPVLEQCLAEDCAALAERSGPPDAPPAAVDEPAPDVAAAAVADVAEPGPRPDFADSIILQYADLTGVGLEVGPLCFPKVPPEHPGIHYADWASREELQKKYADDPVVKPENIVPIHFVIGSKTFPEAVGGKKFDYVILSHVIEHFPDMIGRLAEIASILTPRGVISLVVPDKRYTFDRLRPLTRLAEVIEAHVLGRKEPGAAQIFEHTWLWHEVDAVTAWHRPETLPQTATNDPAWALEVARKTAISRDYVDVHCGVFTDLSFLVLLQQIVQLGLLPLELAFFSPVAPETNQFFLTLRLQPDRDRAVASFDDAIALARQEEDPVAVKIRGLEQQIDALMTSSSWRMTAPLRRLKEKLGR